MDTSSIKFSTGKTILNIIIFLVLFLAGDLLSSVFFDFAFRIWQPSSNWMYVIRSLGCLILTYFLFVFYVKAVLHLSLHNFRISFFASPQDIICAVALPTFVVVVFVLIGSASFNENLSKAATADIILDAISRALRAGILEEMLFRGFIMKLIESRWNKAMAILVPSFVFSLSHIPSMEVVTLGGVLLLIVSGTLVGVMFSLVTYKSNSISSSALIHIVWNFVMVTDVLHIFSSVDPYGGSIFSICLPTNNILVTGGGFGEEASIVAIVGYAFVCLWVLRGKNKRFQVFS